MYARNDDWGSMFKEDNRAYETAMARAAEMMREADGPEVCVTCVRTAGMATGMLVRSRACRTNARRTMDDHEAFEGACWALFAGRLPRLDS